MTEADEIADGLINKFNRGQTQDEIARQIREWDLAGGEPLGWQQCHNVAHAIWTKLRFGWPD